MGDDPADAILTGVWLHIQLNHDLEQKEPAEDLPVDRTVANRTCLFSLSYTDAESRY